jgi:hypothetical protein
LVAGSNSFLIYFIRYLLKVYIDRILTRQEREILVLDLYDQGKGTREIVQELRMSFKGKSYSEKNKRRKQAKSRQIRYLTQHEHTNSFLKEKLY